MQQEIRAQLKTGIPEPESMDILTPEQQQEIKQYAAKTILELQQKSEAERIAFIADQAALVATLKEVMKTISDVVFTQQQIQLLSCEALDKVILGQPVEPLGMATVNEAKDLLNN